MTFMVLLQMKDPSGERAFSDAVAKANEALERLDGRL
jgi:hypothetical protein